MYKLRCNSLKTGKVCVFVEVTKCYYAWRDEFIAPRNLNLDSRYSDWSVLSVGRFNHWLTASVTRRMGKRVKFRAGRFAMVKRKIYFPLGNKMAFSLSTNSLLSHHITELRRFLSETPIYILMKYNSITVPSERKERTYLVLEIEEAEPAYVQANNRISGITFLTHGWYDVKIPRVICIEHAMPREMQLISGFAASGCNS